MSNFLDQAWSASRLKSSRNALSSDLWFEMEAEIKIYTGREWSMSSEKKPQSRERKGREKYTGKTAQRIE